MFKIHTPTDTPPVEVGFGHADHVMVHPGRTRIRGLDAAGYRAAPHVSAGFQDNCRVASSHHDFDQYSLGNCVGLLVGIAVIARRSGLAWRHPGGAMVRCRSVSGHLHRRHYDAKCFRA